MKSCLILFWAVVTVTCAVMGYPQERLMPDGGAVPEDQSGHEDSVASASEAHAGDYEDSDDSDMYMEPDEAASAQPNPKIEEPVDEPKVTLSEVSSVTSSPIIEETRVTATVSEPVRNPEPRPDDRSIVPDSQNFFPSFAELFANHRLSYAEQQQQQRFRPNRFLGYFQRDRNAAYQAAASNVKDNTQHPLLGSGNFGVIRGGTYYPEDKDAEEYSVDESLYNPYYSSNTARGRAYYRNPKPQPIRGGDFFANFRDFADITAPPKSSFSHLSVVYANRNGTKGRANEPRNIIETLRMLEEQGDEDVNGMTTTTETPGKKLSQGKRKLIKMRKFQDDKARKSRMTNVEPLLALS
ncbi:uncharacterized protein LOC135170689 isoform X2 [Diachasmimorpha longicaudata]|uniref:uncharacterized protein LOC135170689 isoform X2 n=1 Tax=Diachasmimorpha longicaudata TaxID=58733 RepID=UPI0030B89E10